MIDLVSSRRAREIFEEYGGIMATQTLDVKGLNCPMPVLKTKKAMKALSNGETLEVESTDPGSVADLKAFCRATGDEVLESVEEDGVFRFLLRKG